MTAPSHAQSAHSRDLKNEANIDSPFMAESAAKHQTTLPARFSYLVTTVEE